MLQQFFISNDHEILRDIYKNQIWEALIASNYMAWEILSKSLYGFDPFNSSDQSEFTFAEKEIFNELSYNFVKLKLIELWILIKDEYLFLNK